MRDRRGRLARADVTTIAATAAAIAVIAACCCIRLFGLVNAVNNSPAEVTLLVIPFLTAFALGYETGLAIGLAATGALIAALQAGSGAFSPLELMFTVGPWAAGRIMRSRRRLAEQLRARNDELRAQQEAYTAEAVRYERSRIAADLHDLVGHALSLMVVQAGAGQRAVRGQEENARIALEHAGQAAREARAEMGAVAGLLAGDAPACLPGELDQVAEVVRRMRKAGLEVTYQVGRVDDTVSAEVMAAVGRIVTEALTNALKHAPGAPVTVDVRVVGGHLEATVGNGPARGAGHGLGRAGGGHGLTGLRDRAAAAGGRLGAGPTEEGGWRVHAVFPEATRRR
jgi:signal transduction histidine kinase